MPLVQQDKHLHTQKDMYTELLAFFNAIDEVFVSYDFVGQKVLHISNACEKLFGYTVAELLANNQLWLAMVYQPDRYIVISEYKALLRGEQVNSQHRIIRKDGVIRWVEKKIAPVLANEKTVRFDGVIRDITDRREEEERCRKSEAMYRQIVETAQEGIWTIDENNITNFVNKKLAGILGYEPHEMLGRPLFDFMDEENTALAIERLKKTRKGSITNLDMQYLKKDGAPVWANISTNGIFNEEGVYKGTLAMITDITNKRADEEALKKSEANLRTVFDNTDSAYILVNSERKIVSFNALAQKYSEDNNSLPLVVNNHIKNYFAPERWGVIEQFLTKVAAGETVSYELNFTTKSGVTKWHEIRWLNVKGGDGNNWGFILVNMDITGTKTAALEKEKITTELIQHNNHLEQFTYIVSHNLRAPVANIIGLSDLLKEHDLEPDMRQDVVEKISSSITNIDVIIQDLNHILQARKPVNEKKETVYFNQLVDVIKTSVYNSLANKNVQINCSFDEAAAVFTIRSYLYSIFYNLISNSIKYCKAGVAPVITISSHKFDNKLALIFKDNGKGIDLEKNGGQLFGLYKRFDTTIEGKGMGLFMVKTQVEALGGTISLNSKLGEGTEFTIEFPL